MNEKDFLIVVASDTIIISEVYSRIAKVLEGGRIWRNHNIPALIIKGEKKKIDKIKQYIIILALSEAEFANKLTYIDSQDLK